MNRLLSTLLIVFAMSGVAMADDAPVRQPADNVWGNGPLLSIPAVTVPAGSFATGAALLDQISHAGSGASAVPAPDLNNVNFRTAFIYGASDDFNLGLWPVVGLGKLPQSQGTSDVAMGDWMIEGQYRLHESHEGDWLPTLSLNLAETFPTGQYDRLSPSSNPLGAGTCTTTLGLYAQSLFWMPTGRILRASFDLSYALSNQVGIRGMSVYDTPDGFLGHANPGASILGDLTLEYSLSQKWSAATEIQLELDNPTHVAGTGPAGALFQVSSELGHVLYVTPYLEYDWNATEGLSAGARIYTTGHNETPNVMPMILFTRYFEAI